MTFYAKLGVRASPCNLSFGNLKQWLGEKGLIVDVSLRDEISTPMCPFDPKTSCRQS